MGDKCNFAVCLALYHVWSKDIGGIHHGVLTTSLDFIGSSEPNSIPLDRILGARKTASFLGLTPSVFNNCRNRYEDFPKPVV